MAGRKAIAASAVGKEHHAQRTDMQAQRDKPLTLASDLIAHAPEQNVEKREGTAAMSASGLGLATESDIQSPKGNWQRTCRHSGHKEKQGNASKQVSGSLAEATLRTAQRAITSVTMTHGARTKTATAG